MRTTPCLVALALWTVPAAADQTIPISVAMRVGQTRRLWVVAAHNADCSTSAARSVEIASPPALGRITEQEGAPSRVAHSISGTCLGARVTGLGIDYTAERPGTDSFAFDGVFGNGRVHYAVTARNR